MTPTISDADKLEALAARCEDASGPDRDLDAEIAVTALGYVRDGVELYAPGDTYSIREPDYYDLDGQNRELPAYTASLDAAMTLVPEGWGRAIEQERPTRACEASLSSPGCEPWGQFSINAEGSTLALALYAAALKSRARTLKQGEE